MLVCLCGLAYCVYYLFRLMHIIRAQGRDLISAYIGSLPCASTRIIRCYSPSALALASQMHGHDDVQEVILSYWAEDAWSRLDVRLEDHVGSLDHIQDLTKEAHVEGDE